MGRKIRTIYSREQKMQVMHSFLTTFGGSWAKTHAALGIPVNTLKLWNSDDNFMVEVRAYGEMMNKNSSMNVNMADMVDAQILTSNAAFIAEVDKVRTMALEKAKTLIRKSKSLKDTTGILKLLNDIKTGVSPDEEKQNNNKGGDTYNQLIQLYHGTGKA